MPAKRTGKASSRQSRQRRQQQRSSQRAPLQRPTDVAGTNAPDVTPAAPLAPTPSVSAPAVASGSSAARSTRPASKFAGLYGSSRLSEQAHLEYHYVERDLRNIGVLVAVMLVLLIIATVVLNAIGIGPS
ncbi:MAG: hypothetical protein ABI534_01535 [Chloroflexota bacterium]